MARKFNATKAARAIFSIMKQMGVKPNRPGRECWVQEGEDEAFICLNRNAIRISITEKGFVVRSSYAVFSPSNLRTTSFRKFKKHMGHVLCYTS